MYKSFLIITAFGAMTVAQAQRTESNRHTDAFDIFVWPPSARNSIVKPDGN